MEFLFSWAQAHMYSLDAMFYVLIGILVIDAVALGLSVYLAFTGQRKKGYSRY